MSTIAILGGSVIGCATALQFARSGWQVSLIDAEFDLISQEIAGPGDVAVRPGAPHTVQAHGFPSRACFELKHRLPDVLEALFAAGAEPSLFAPPPHLHDGGRPQDGDFNTFRTRRVTLDRVLAEAVRAQDGIEVLPVRAVGRERPPRSPPSATPFAPAGGSLL
jgi:2-polyprenyl-6-methoxyphenol hydroxylase-like FAD-dependent oxidoreductase